METARDYRKDEIQRRTGVRLQLGDTSTLVILQEVRKYVPDAKLGEVMVAKVTCRTMLSDKADKDNKDN